VLQLHIYFQILPITSVTILIEFLPYFYLFLLLLLGWRNSFTCSKKCAFTVSQYSCMGFSNISPCHQMGWDPQKVNVLCAFSLNRIYAACIFCIKDNADIYVAKLIGGLVPHKVLLICMWY